MRFLLGLMMGAAVVLALAETLTGNVDWGGRLTAAAERMGELLHARQPAQPQGREPLVRRREPGAAEPAGEPIPRPPDPQPVEHAVADNPPQKSPQKSQKEPASDPAGLADALMEWPAAASLSQAEPEQADLDATVDTLAAVQDEPGPPRSPLQPEPVADAVGPMNSAAVWVPFHSEMSAEGFAERLTQSLDHPFRVERRGPGSYQVVFAYSDEPQRQALLERAAEATGLPL